MNKSKSELALVTFGVILFIISLIGIVCSLFMFFEVVNSDSIDRSIEDYFGLLAISVPSAILFYYIKVTNFGMKKSDLQNIIDEKEKLKALLEISELKKKLNNEK